MPVADKPLLVIAPTMLMTHQVAQRFGLDPVLCKGLRAIHKPELLRGWSKGTPFIAAFRDDWPLHERGRELSALVDIRISDGTLRIAQDDDLKRVKGEL